MGTAVILAGNREAFQNVGSPSGSSSRGCTRKRRRMVRTVWAAQIGATRILLLRSALLCRRVGTGGYVARQSEYLAGASSMTAYPSSWWFMCAPSAVASRSNNPVISFRGLTRSRWPTQNHSLLTDGGDNLTFGLLGLFPMSSHPLETALARRRRTAMTINAETLLDRRAPAAVCRCCSAAR